nr:putative ribonuclease H-like domain-containing protein [Tanacetum cinerariifolium]
MNTTVLPATKENNIRLHTRLFLLFSWAFFMGTKDETFYILKDFIALIENQLNKKVKAIRCDNGTEFQNAKLIDLCGEKGIKRDYSNSRTSQQNGVAERKNRTLIETSRSMLADSKLPTMFWTEAVSTACYVLNRVSITNPHNKTPYELLSGKVNDVSAPMESNLDYAEELARIQRQEHKAHSAAAKYGFEFSNETAEMLHQAEIKTHRNLVLAAGDPAGSIVSTGGVSAGSISASSVPARSVPARSVPAGGVLAGSINSAGFGDLTASESVLAVFTPDHAANSTLHPGHSLGSNEHSTRFPSPSDLGNHQPTADIFSSSSYDDDFCADVTKLASSVTVDPVATKRVKTIHPQSQIIGELQSLVQTRSTVQKSKFGESAFISYVHNQNWTNHTDHLHCVFTCFLSQLEPSSVAKALEDPDWVTAMQAEMQQFYNQQVHPYVNKDIGIVDSGCSRSMTGNKDKLDDFVQVKGGTITFGGGDGKITGKGTIRTSKLNFENVYYMEELQHFNMFSISQICDKKNKVLFTDDIQPEQQINCLLEKASLEESTKWHKRMAHVNFKTINKLSKHGLVKGLPLKLFTNEHNCVACNKGKQHKASYMAISAGRTISEPLKLVYMDLFGPTFIKSIDHKYYSLVVTDDFSRFSWAFFLGTKDETFYILKDFISLIENQLNKRVKAIRVSITNPHNKKPYELLSGKVPNIRHLKPFGCQVTILNTSDHLEKFDGKANDSFLVGYAANSMAYRVYNLSSKKVKEIFNLRYLEDKPNVQGLGQECFLGPKVNDVSAPMENNFDYAKELARLQRQEHEAHSVVGNIVFTGGVHAGGVPASSVPASHVPARSVPARSSEHSTRFPSPFDLGNHQPTAGIFFSSSYDDDFYADVTNLASSVAVDPAATKRQVWKLVPLPDGKFAIKTKWILKNKRDARGIMVRNKARLVAQGHRQEEGIDYDEVYVDGIIFGSTNKAWCDEFEVLMKGEFEMSAMGELTFFLGLQVKQLPDGIFISQDKYVKDMLKKFDMESVRTATTPYEVPKPKSKNKPDDAVDVHLDRSMIGSLMYLTASRPDIMFAV